LSSQQALYDFNLNFVPRHAPGFISYILSRFTGCPSTSSAQHRAIFVKYVKSGCECSMLILAKLIVVREVCGSETTINTEIPVPGTSSCFLIVYISHVHLTLVITS
jgi:hypothetical protein